MAAVSADGQRISLQSDNHPQAVDSPFGGRITTPPKRRVQKAKMDSRKTTEPVSNHPTPTRPTEAEVAATQAMYKALDEVLMAPPQQQPPTSSPPTSQRFAMAIFGATPCCAPVPRAPVPCAPVPSAPVPLAPVPRAPVPHAPLPLQEFEILPPPNSEPEQDLEVPSLLPLFLFYQQPVGTTTTATNPSHLTPVKVEPVIRQIYGRSHGYIGRQRSRLRLGPN